MPGRLLFWADCGPDVGSGHVMRCAALAEAGRRIGFASLLATRHPSMSVLDRWRLLGAEVIEFAPPDEGRAKRTWFETLSTQTGAVFRFIDHYGLDASFHEDARAPRVPLCIIDDLGLVDAPADLVVNPNPGAERFASSYRRAGRALLGADYALIRPEIARGSRKGGAGMLVTLGGGDVAHETLALASFLAKAFPKEQVCILHDAENDQRLPPNLSLLPPGDLHQPLLRADLLVCGGGVTALEATCLGIPTIVSVRADNQRPGVEALVDNGSAVLAGTRDDIVALAGVLLHDAAMRSKMSLTGRKLIDGRGAERTIMQACVLLGIPVQAGSRGPQRLREARD